MQPLQIDTAIATHAETLEGAIWWIRRHAHISPEWHKAVFVTDVRFVMSIRSRTGTTCICCFDSQEVMIRTLLYIYPKVVWVYKDFPSREIYTDIKGLPYGVQNEYKWGRLVSRPIGDNDE